MRCIHCSVFPLFTMVSCATPSNERHCTRISPEDERAAKFIIDAIGAKSEARGKEGYRASDALRAMTRGEVFLALVDRGTSLEKLGVAPDVLDHLCAPEPALSGAEADLLPSCRTGALDTAYSD